MRRFRWNPEKNELLRRERGVSFEEVELAIERGDLLDIVEHPNKLKYPDQRLFIVRIKDYVFLVPFVEDQSEIFLKTVIPSRAATKKYLSGRRNNEEKS